MLQPGIGLVQLPGPVSNPGFKQNIGGVDCLRRAAPGQCRIDVARNEGQQLLIAQGIADVLGITLHHQHAANLSAVEQRNAQP